MPNAVEPRLRGRVDRGQHGAAIRPGVGNSAGATGACLADRRPGKNCAVRQPSAQRALAGRVVPVAVAAGLATPAVALRLGGVEPAPLTGVLLYGAAFIGAALLLAWVTELAQLDLPPGLAIALLAFIAIMPEYAIDLLFAHQASDDPSKAPLALANMTGANRLLIGVGWSLVVLVGYAGFRRGRRRNAGPAARPPRKRRAQDGNGVQLLLSRLSAVDVVLLGLVSVYTLGFLLRTTLSLLDNQWTLLVGAVPVAYAAATLQASGLPIDPVQRQELFLTAAQSVFAVSLLADTSRWDSSGWPPPGGGSPDWSRTGCAHLRPPRPAAADPGLTTCYRPTRGLASLRRGVYDRSCEELDR